MLTRNNLLLVLSFFITTTISCSRFSGNFGYKTETMDTYRLLKNGMEFESGQHVDWVYNIEKSGTGIDVGVVVLQKKAVWIDIESRNMKVGLENSRIYGEFQGQQPGEYRIVLIVKNKIVDETGYTIYSDNELDLDE